MTVWEATSRGDGWHPQMHRSSCNAIRRPSGPFIGKRGPPLHWILPVEWQAGHATASSSCATWTLFNCSVVTVACTVPPTVVLSPDRITWRFIGSSSPTPHGCSRPASKPPAPSAGARPSSCPSTRTGAAGRS
ncbi:hypothetical protein RSP781_19060 [Ralstonia pseudosolanacearum]|nr:hypothetical protein RSP781_19060 [Ralstonia pseudosolanacearum]